MLELKSAIEVQRREQDWYRLPSLQRRKSVPPKSMVKLILDHPKGHSLFIWVRVVSKGIARYTGIIEPSPWNVYTRLPKGHRRGDKIEFMPRHVYDIRLEY